MEQAARKSERYHLWFHPFNLGTSPRMFDALEQILQIAASLREQGKLDILTMEQAAMQVLGRTN